MSHFTTARLHLSPTHSKFHLVLEFPCEPGGRKYTETQCRHPTTRKETLICMSRVLKDISTMQCNFFLKRPRTSCLLGSTMGLTSPTLGDRSILPTDIQTLRVSAQSLRAHLSSLPASNPQWHFLNFKLKA